METLQQPAWFSSGSSLSNLHFKPESCNIIQSLRSSLLFSTSSHPSPTGTPIKEIDSPTSNAFNTPCPQPPNHYEALNTWGRPQPRYLPHEAWWQPWRSRLWGGSNIGFDIILVYDHWEHKGIGPGQETKLRTSGASAKYDRFCTNICIHTHSY